MANMKFPLDDELEKLFIAEKADGKLRWIKIAIEKEKIVKVGEGVKSDDAAADLDKLKASVEDAKQPFFAAVRYDGEGHWVQLNYVPDDSMVKVRMLYAGSILHLKEKLGSAIVASLKVTEKDEVSWKEVEPVGKKAVGGKSGPDFDLMTDAERERYETEKEHLASLASAAPVAMATMAVKFPMADKAKEVLEAFKKGDLSAASFWIDGKPETIVADEATQVKEKGATIEEVMKTVNPKGESRYIIYRFTREVDGEEKSDIFIVYYCSSGTPIRKRMVYASGKSAFIAQAVEKGEAKVLEFPDVEDATSKELEDSLKAPVEEEEEEKKVKPKPAGKGPRMLI